MRRDDDAALGIGGHGLDGGHQIREALAYAGTGLDHEMVQLGDGPRDRFGHLQLLRPLLIVSQLAGDGPTRPQNRSAGHDAIIACSPWSMVSWRLHRLRTSD